MNEICLRYAECINQMRDPANYGKVEFLNSMRVSLHERLAKAFNLNREETKTVTDNLPNLPDPELAKYLEEALMKRSDYHDENIRKNWSKYEIYIYLYHETWWLPGEVDNLKTLGIIDQQSWAKARDCIKSFFEWIDANKTAVAMDEPTDGIEPWSRYRDMYKTLFEVHPSLLCRYRSGYLFEFIVKAENKERMTAGKADWWLDEQAKKACVPLNALKEFLLSSAVTTQDDYREFAQTFESLVKKALEV